MNLKEKKYYKNAVLGLELAKERAKDAAKSDSIHFEYWIKSIIDWATMIRDWEKEEAEELAR